MNKWSGLVFIAVAISGGAFDAARAIIPQVMQVGAEEALPNGSGRLSSIATDANNQPHIVADGGNFAYYYDKINGTWRFYAKDMGEQFYNPHVEIDANNHAWYTGVMVGRRNGLGLVVRTDMLTNPSAYGSFNLVKFAPVFDVGTHSVDPHVPNTTVVSGDNGKYQRFVFSGAVASRAVATGPQGQMFAGTGGEKNHFWVSKAGAILHADNTTRSVFHGATGGYSRSPSAYQNSYRQSQGLPHIVWAPLSLYPSQSDDGCYPRVVSDAKDPKIAYISSDFSVNGRYGPYPGVAVNIYDGSNMRFSASHMLHVDTRGASGLRRYAPDMAPAIDGGVWITWTRDARIRLRYIPSDATTINSAGPEIDVGPGVRSSICVDRRGDVHIAYNRIGGGMAYRKLTVSGQAGGVTIPKDFNMDGKDDLAVFNDKTLRWTIQTTATNVPLLENVLFGASNTAPVAGYFTSTNEPTIGYFDPKNATWTIRNSYSNDSTFSITFGPVDGIPVVGDYDGDGLDDLCVFNPKTFQWSLRTVGGAIISNNLQHGFAGVVPFAGDYNNDGKDDVGVYSPASGRWYIRNVAGGGIVWNFQWGSSTMIPVARDFNEDGTADLGLFDALNARWYVVDTVTKAIIYAQRKFGDGNALPTPGRFDGPAKTRLATYQPSSGRWSILQENGQSMQPLAPLSTGTPVPGDFFGTGSNTMAIYEEATGIWRIQSNGSVRVIQHGFNGGKPVVADFNGDGRDDLGIFWAGKWYIRNVAGGAIAWGVNWGAPSMVAVAGDYNNDGADDLAVYYEATGRWYIRTLGGAIVAWNLQHGFPGGSAVEGDFDGDGRSDLAIVNRSNGKWYVMDVTGAVKTWGSNWGGFTGARYVSGDFNNDGISERIVYGAGSGVTQYKWYVFGVNQPNPELDGAAWGMEGAEPFIFNGKVAVLQQDRSWYVRENADSTLSFNTLSGILSAIPVGTTSL